MEEQIGHTLDIDWLGDKVLVLIGKQLAELFEADPSIESILNKDPCLDPCLNGLVVNADRDGKTYWFVVIKERSRLVIQHESIHLAQFLLDKRNIPTDVDNTEVLAYLVGFIYEKICTFAKVKP